MYKQTRFFAKYNHTLIKTDIYSAQNIQVIPLPGKFGLEKAGLMQSALFNKPKITWAYMGTGFFVHGLIIKNRRHTIWIELNW